MGSRFQGYSPSRQQEQEAAGYTTAATGKQKVSNVHVFLFIQSRTPIHRMLSSPTIVKSFHLINCILNPPRHTQRLVVIVDSINLTAKISYYNQSISMVNSRL